MKHAFIMEINQLTLNWKHSTTNVQRTRSPTQVQIINKAFISLTIICIRKCFRSMELYETVAICIGIAVTSFALIIFAVTSIFYCIYISCQGCIKPTLATALDGTLIADKSACNSNQFPKPVVEKYNRNLTLSSASTFVWRRREIKWSCLK